MAKLLDCVAVTSLETIDPALVVTATVSAGFLGTGNTPGLMATWAPITNPYVTGIQFQYGPSDLSAGLKQSDAVKEAQSWNDSSVVPDKTYTVRYRAIGVGANVYGPWSAPANYAVPANPPVEVGEIDTTPPADPTGLVLSQQTTVNPDGTVIVEIIADWNDNADSDLDGYDILWMANGVAQTTRRVGGSRDTYPGRAGVTYAAYVWAVDRVGNISLNPDDDSLGVASGDGTGPGAVTPTNLQGAARRIILEWDRPADADYLGMDLYRNTVNTVPGTPYQRRLTGTNWADQNVTAGVVYHYWGVSYDRSGNPGPTVYFGSATPLYVSVGGGDVAPEDPVLVTYYGDAAGVTGAGPALFAGEAAVMNNRKEGNVVHIRQPVGGTNENSGPGDLGYWRIVLPQGWTNTMISFDVEISQYNGTGKQVYSVYGYAYNAGAPYWATTRAKVVGDRLGVKNLYFSRSNAHGGRPCINIGVAADAWAYSKVTVTNVRAAHTPLEVANWESGWSVDLTTDAMGQIDAHFPPAALMQEAYLGENLFEGVGGVVATLPNFKTGLGNAAGVIDGGDLLWKDAVTWNGTDILNRPVELTDGRVGAGLTSIGRAVAVDVPDVRSTNETPSQYRARGRGLWQEFKERGAIGVPGTVSYVQLETAVLFQDVSGGSIVQTARSAEGIWQRRSVTNSDVSGWTAWVKSYDQLNRPAFNADLLDSVGGLATDAGYKTGLGNSAGVIDGGLLLWKDQADWAGDIIGAGKPSDNAGTSLVLTPYDGNTIVAGNTATRIGSGDWNTGATSQAITGPCYASARLKPATVSQGNQMFGLTDSFNGSYVSIAFAWYTPGDGNAYIYESGSSYGSWAVGVTADDVWSVTYDGGRVHYARNGTILRTVVTTVGRRLMFATSIPYNGLRDIQFGPAQEAPRIDGIQNTTRTGQYGAAQLVTELGNSAGVVDAGPALFAPGNRVLNDRLENSVRTIGQPDGATLNIGAGGQPGQIQITLPFLATNAMMSFEVTIYNYTSGETLRYLIGGYDYIPTQWINCSASYIGPRNRALPVKFGAIGNNARIWIGNVGTPWEYSVISVRNLMIGYSSQGLAWESGWSIGLNNDNVSSYVNATIAVPRAGDTVFGEGIFESSAGAPATLPNFKTSAGNAAGVNGAGALLWKDSVAYGTADVSGFGSLAGNSNIRLGGPSGSYWAGVIDENNSYYVTNANAITGLGNAAGVTGGSDWIYSSNTGSMTPGVIAGKTQLINTSGRITSGNGLPLNINAMGSVSSPKFPVRSWPSDPQYAIEILASTRTIAGGGTYSLPYALVQGLSAGVQYYVYRDLLNGSYVVTTDDSLITSTDRYLYMAPQYTMNSGLTYTNPNPPPPGGGSMQTLDP